MGDKVRLGNDNTNLGYATGSSNDSHNIFSNHNIVSNYNIISNHNINTYNPILDESPQIIQWLSPLDPRGRHQDLRTHRVDSVGNWLLETSEFGEWRGSDGGAEEAVLFCYGNPGVGKTYLSSLVIDKLCDEPGVEDIAIAMFYCDFRDQQEQTAANIMGAILGQLMVRWEVLEHVQMAFRRAKREVGGRGLRLSETAQMLKQAIAKLPRVFICIDALDECLPKHIVELLESLKDILQGSPSTRIFITGRPQVETEIARYFTARTVLPISPRTEEIKIYLERRLEMDTERDAMSEVLHTDILRIIPERIPEIFLLVSLSIDAVLGETTIFERRQKLNEMTKGNYLEDVYATTLGRIKAQNGSRPRLGMEALMWVSSSERPLHSSELCHALGVKRGSADLDPENVPTIQTLLGCSLGLITVEASSSTVRLVHLTLQEYLSNSPGLFQSPHSMIAEVCLTYLHFRCVWELPPTLRSAPPTVPLAAYASCYWGEHIRKGNMEGMNRLALELLVGFEKHISSQLLLLRYSKDRHWWEPSFDGRGGPHGFTGLHAAAFLGIVEIVTTLLEIKEWDINTVDSTGRTALAWAVVGGHEDVVRILLHQKDININTIVTKDGQTALSWAKKNGREAIVKLLQKRNHNLDMPALGDEAAPRLVGHTAAVVLPPARLPPSPRPPLGIVIHFLTHFLTPLPPLVLLCLIAIALSLFVNYLIF